MRRSTTRTTRRTGTTRTTRTTRATTTLLLAALSALAVQGCSTSAAMTVPGTAAATGQVREAGKTSAPCTDVTYADPWIAFEPELTRSGTLSVGKRAWVGHGTRLADITVTGDTAAVTLSEQSSPTLIKCGTTVVTARWVELRAKSAGTVTVTITGGRTASFVLTVTAD